eukprot:CAMPEP_0113956418 /NCGR_PEP_ID=MMETSP0011_2-20120614/2056_1 /TAXON_ID=101924 /ORGANISM="Rhodosorus marinus" /LENGTH=360 /DNA_ID=CAMNT_0000966573 /DNA_START=606 /DNA_END=1688 /DNA_ORIENTATION=+ /assembly_acc=CAM_ASM_000156
MAQVGSDMMSSGGVGALMSPSRWMQTPPVRGSNSFPMQQSYNGPEMSPQLVVMGSGVGMTPYVEMFGHQILPSPGPDISFTPSFPVVPAQPPQQASVRKSAIKDEFQRWTQDERNQRTPSMMTPILGTQQTLTETPISSVGSKHSLSPQFSQQVQQTAPQRQRYMKVDYGMTPPPQAYPYAPALVGNIPSYPMPMQHLQPPPGTQFEYFDAETKEEPMFARDYHPAYMRQPMPYHEDYYQQMPPGEKLKREQAYGAEAEISSMHRPRTGVTIARKEDASTPAEDDNVVDKQLLKQIRSRDAASKQRSRQKDYLIKLERDNVKFKERVDTLVQQNERLRLDIRMKTGPDRARPPSQARGKK